MEHSHCACSTSHGEVVVSDAGAIELLKLISSLRETRRRLREAERADMLSRGRGGIEAAQESVAAVSYAQRALTSAENALAEFCALNGPPLPCPRKVVEAVYEVAAGWLAVQARVDLFAVSERHPRVPEQHRAAILKVHESLRDQAIEALIEWERDQVVSPFNTQSGWFVGSSGRVS